jgi:hypothetical protein
VDDFVSFFFSLRRDQENYTIRETLWRSGPGIFLSPALLSGDDDSQSPANPIVPRERRTLCCALHGCGLTRTRGGTWTERDDAKASKFSSSSPSNSQRGLGETKMSPILWVARKGAGADTRDGRSA